MSVRFAFICVHHPHLRFEFFDWLQNVFSMDFGGFIR